MSAKLIGGDLLSGIDDDVFRAVAQAGSIGGDEKLDNKERRYHMKLDVWPPYFVKDALVEFEGCSMEETSPGDFITIRTNYGLSVARAIKWRFSEGQVIIDALRTPEIHKTEKILPAQFFGKVFSVKLPGKEKVFFPNKRSFWTVAMGFLTNYGAGGFISNGVNVVKDSFSKIANSRKQAETYKEPTFLENLRKVNEIHKELVEEEAKEAERRRVAKEQKKMEADMERIKLEHIRREINSSKPESWWVDPKNTGG